MARRSSIEARHELKVAQQIIDPRPMFERWAEWLTSRTNMLTVVVPIVAMTMVVPVVSIVTFPLLLLLTIAHGTTKSLLPIRYPMGSKDESNGKPGTGILYVGQVDSKSDYDNFKELWISDDDMRKHMLILGSTGSGKSEALKTIFFNALNWSSGFFIADGKADNKLPTDVYTMVRANGRDADMLVLNFLLAGKTPEQVKRSRRRRTNKLNPFPSADADTIIQMGSNLLPKAEGDAKNWQEKALNLWRSEVAALCYKRDTGGFELSITSFIDYMSLDKVEELYIEGYEESLRRGGDWSYGFVGIKNYLESGCPAYQVSKLLKKHGYGDAPAVQTGATPRGGARAGKEFEQDTMAYEQHSYRTNQLMPVLNLLDKTYGFIFSDKYSEIDMTDVTLRNRILVMLIPSLEKSAAEAENLGKLAIACLRVMMSKNLGAEVEGNHEDLLGSKATNSPCPYIVALDELAYYFSDGIAVMFAQARSLGTAMIAAAQDLEKLTEGARSAEAGAMIANTVTKFFMRIDDTGKTAEMVQKVVGKANVAVRRSYRFSDLGYSRRSDVEVIDSDRVPTSTLQAFGQGEGIVNALGKTTFMKWFYMGKDIEEHRVPEYYINRFLQVGAPTPDDIKAYSVPLSELSDPLRKGKRMLSVLNQDTQLTMSIPSNAVVAALADAARTIGPYASAEERSVALYVAARNAIRKAKESSQAPVVPPADVALPQEADDLDMSLPPRSVIGDEREVFIEPEDTSDLNVLDELVGVSPYVRKTAESVLGLTEGDLPRLPDHVRGVLNAQSSPDVDPVEQMLERSRTVSLSDSVFTGRVFSKFIGSPEAKNPFTGLLQIPKDDWIGAAVKESLSQSFVSRSSDKTVVGLTAAVMNKVEQVEALMDSPDPKAGARSLEMAVSFKVTPSTVPAAPMSSADEVDSYLTDFAVKLGI